MGLITNEDGSGVITGPNEFNIFFVSYDNGASGGYGELGTNDNDTIQGGTSSDIIQLSAGTDALHGGEGSGDTIEAPTYLSVKDSKLDEPGTWYALHARDLVVDMALGTYALNWRDNGGDGTAVISSSGTLSGIEVLSDTRGNDILRGSDFTPLSGSGRIVGETFQLGQGVDHVDGRGGVDTIAVGAYLTSSITFDGVAIDVAAGTMRGLDGAVDTFANIERFSMTQGADVFKGDKNDNWVIGFGGGDTLSGGKGFDVLDYANSVSDGSGVTISGAQNMAAGDTWSETYTGFEQIRGTRDDDRMRGGNGNENYFGNRGDDLLNGGGGNDVLDGGDGMDTLLGGDGKDRLNGGEGVDSLDGGKGIDTLDYSIGDLIDYTLGVNVTLKSGKAIDQWGNEDTVSKVENVTGTKFRDLIKGSNGDNVIRGGDGRDNLGGLKGDDTLHGGKGKDSLGGGADNDTLNGDKGDDTLFGGEGDDTLNGGADNDILFGEEGADILNGGKGKDQLRDDKGLPNMFHFVNDDIRDALSDGKRPVVGANALANQLNGGDGDDKVFGTGYLQGGKNDDELRGAGFLDGGQGNDMLFADAAFDSTGSGYAVLSGGLGRDQLTGIGFPGSAASYVYSATSLTVNLGVGVANLGGGDRDTLTNISTVFGTNHDDVMKGHDGQEQFIGLGGNDTITLRSKAGAFDSANGGAGNDIIKSTGDGSVSVFGGKGTDQITVSGGTRAEVDGGKDADQIEIRADEGIVSGGAGNDTIVFFRNDTNVNDIIKGGAGNDTIRLKGSGRAVVEGNSGNDKIILSGGVSLNDVFSVTLGPGRDTLDIKESVMQVRVNDFDIGNDLIKLAAALPGNVSTFAQLKAAAVNVGSEVNIGLADGGVLILSDLQVADLQSGMFDL